MFENLDVFQMAHAMSTHAAAKQALSAQNMANADTPDYAALDLPAFSEMVEGDPTQFSLTATRAGHFNGADEAFSGLAFERDAQKDPNGNSVSLEVEMLQSVNAKRQHDRAISIYKSSLGVLRTAIGRP